MSLAQRLRQLRYARGWGVNDLATRAQISRTALYMIENGKTTLPRASTIRRIAHVLNVDPETLISCHEEDSAEPERPAPESVPEFRADQPLPVSWLIELELEHMFRLLLYSPLRDTVAAIVRESYRLLTPEAGDESRGAGVPSQPVEDTLRPSNRGPDDPDKPR